MTPADLYRLLALVAAGDPAAADEIDAMADKLRDVAAALRSRVERTDEFVGGTSDRVLISVVGPDGCARQKTDTGGT